MDITGKIIVVMPAKEGVSQSTGNPWKSQDYVIETQEAYPKKCCFNVFGAEKIQEMNIQLGETLTVSIEINANEYQGKWYNQVRAWKVQRLAAGQGQQQAAQQQQGCAPYYPDRQPAEQAPWPQAGLTPPTQAPAQPQGQQPQNDSLPF